MIRSLFQTRLMSGVVGLLAMTSGAALAADWSVSGYGSIGYSYEMKRISVSCATSLSQMIINATDRLSQIAILGFSLICS